MPAKKARHSLGDLAERFRTQIPSGRCDAVVTRPPYGPLVFWRQHGVSKIDHFAVFSIFAPEGSDPG